MASSPLPTYFPSSLEFRAWLMEHYDSSLELWVGFYKKSSKQPSITWPEAVDEALCFGWIDGLRKRVDDVSYCIRFTPRTASSTWSAVNIRRVQELIQLGCMHPHGLHIFVEQADESAAIVSYEQRHNAKLDESEEQRFQANSSAWEFFQTQSSSYRKAAVGWIMSAKKEATRSKRLDQLIEHSAQHLYVPALSQRAPQK
jgi:uncharacterized protein YdeI (YjbR/CyaY-like superfamily)